MDEYRTVVFRITDQVKAADFIGRFTAALAESSEVAPGVEVTGVGMGDDMTRCERLDEYAGYPSLDDLHTSASIRV